MLIINQLRNYFWNIDPGYFNLKQGMKTVLGVLISVWLVREQPLVIKLMAAIACGFSMQGVVAKTWLTRLGQVAVFDLIYFSSFALGLVVRESADLTAITLVLLGFFSNYIRRFGLEWSAAPLMAWTLCFLATILPFNDASEAWSHIQGLLIGFGVSAFMLIFIFPENYSRLFIENSNRFFKTLKQGLTELRRDVLTAESSSINFQNKLVEQTKVTLAHLADSNQSIQVSMVFIGKETFINDFLVLQYALVNAYTLMIDAFCTLSQSKQSMPRTTRLILSHVIKQFVSLLSAMRMRSDYMVVADSIRINLPKFAQQLCQETLQEPNVVVALLNLKLGFDLLHHHLTKLLGLKDAT